MRADRLVPDTNVVISALLQPSSIPAQVLDDAADRSRIIITDSLQRELTAAVLAPKFDNYVVRDRRERLLPRLAPLMELVPMIQIVRICRDPHDDTVLAAALNGRADVIVSGDKDLLALHPVRDIAILTPKEYSARSIAEGA